MKRNKKQNYNHYLFTGRDWLEYGVKLFIKATMICYLFYDSYKACLLLLPFALFDYKSMKKRNW